MSGTKDHTISVDGAGRKRAAAGQATAAGRRARLAAMTIFFVNGLVLGSYFVRIPSLKIAHQLSTRGLGIALTVAALAALLGMQFAGWLSARYGSARVAWVSVALLPVSLLGVGAANGIVELMAALVAFGILGGLMDVSMNALAVAVERTLRRPVLSSCHAAWSVGAIVGSLLGGLAAKLNWSLTGHYLRLAPAALLLAMLAGAVLSRAPLDHGAGATAEPAREKVGWRTGWTRGVIAFGVMGAMVMLCEGSVATWSGVFLHTDRGASLATASLAYIGFTICEAAGRTVGDRLRRRFGAAALVRACTVVAIAGLALALNPSAVLGIAGFSVLGIGLSLIVPIIFSAVGNSGADRAKDGAALALARFATLAYSGILIGPVLIGWAAGIFGIAWALGGLLLLLAWVLLNAQRASAADVPVSAPAGQQPSRLPVPADDPQARAHARRPDGLGRAQGQDLELEALQGRRRIDAKLLVEQGPDILVGLERLAATSGAAQRRDQLLVEPLVQRVGADERAQLGDQLGVPAEGNVGLNPRLDRAGTLFLQLRRVRHEQDASRHVRERGSGPQIRGGAQRQHGLVVPGGAEQRGAAPQQRHEVRHVYLLRGDPEQIAR